eukprot:442555-Pleurochrysis_carterae.AAC.2
MYAVQNDNCPPSLDETPRLDAAKPCLNALEADEPISPTTPTRPGRSRAATRSQPKSPPAKTPASGISTACVSPWEC